MNAPNMKVAKVGSVIGRTKRAASMSASFEDDDDQGDGGGRFALQTAQDLRVQKGDDVLREGLLDKRVQLKDLAWVPRYVTLTKTALMFAGEAGGQIREQISLLDITTCESVEQDTHNTIVYHNKDGARDGVGAGKEVGTGRPPLSRTRSYIGSFRASGKPPTPRRSCAGPRGQTWRSSCGSCPRAG